LSKAKQAIFSTFCVFVSALLSHAGIQDLLLEIPSRVAVYGVDISLDDAARELLISCLQEALETNASRYSGERAEFHQKIVSEMKYRNALSSTLLTCWKRRTGGDNSYDLIDQLLAATLKRQTSTTSNEVTLKKLLKKFKDLVFTITP